MVCFESSRHSLEESEVYATKSLNKDVNHRLEPGGSRPHYSTRFILQYWIFCAAICIITFFKNCEWYKIQELIWFWWIFSHDFIDCPAEVSFFPPLILIWYLLKVYHKEISYLYFNMPRIHVRDNKGKGWCCTALPSMIFCQVRIRYRASCLPATVWT